MEAHEYDTHSHILELEMRVLSLEICIDRLLSLNPTLVRLTPEQIKEIREGAAEKTLNRFNFLGIKKSE